MSRKERDRLKVMTSLEAGRVKQVEAARLLRLSVRQMRRIQGRTDGRRRGKWHPQEESNL